MERLTEKELKDGWIVYNRTEYTYETTRFNSSPIRKIIEKLKQYEDLEEQKKLLKPPCAVDSEVWYIDKYADLSIEIVRGVVDGYLWYRSCGFALNIVWDKPIMGHFGYKRKEIPFSEVGKTVFLTREEAEAALKEMSE